MDRSRMLFAALASIALAACGSSDHGGGDGAPAAPSGLTAESLADGAHLTWTDNSDNETEFMVMRMEDGVDTEYEVVATVEFNTTQYHDAPLTAGSTYMYQIMAMNDDGESLSNEVTFNAP
jgi:hypothetical protein